MFERFEFGETSARLLDETICETVCFAVAALRPFASL